VLLHGGVRDVGDQRDRESQRRSVPHSTSPRR
jgi:hypothetical protein